MASYITEHGLQGASQTAGADRYNAVFSFPQLFNFIISFMTPIINAVLEKCLTGLVAWQHNTSDDETATRLMYGVFQTQVNGHSLPWWLLRTVLRFHVGGDHQD